MPDTVIAAKTLYVVMQEIPAKPVIGSSGDEDEINVSSFTVPRNWREITRISADSTEAALRYVADSTEGGFEGLAVAIPARSFKPVRVSVETVSRVKFEDAGA